MRELKVWIEISGQNEYVGLISGETSDDARFCYDEEYINNIGKPISISLPLSSEPFSARRTKNFFEGLLPEGFSRKAVAEWMHADEDDYLTILATLGQECIGAVRITEEGIVTPPSEYVKLTGSEVRALAAEGATRSTEIILKSHLSLAGATGKVGLFYDNGIWYQPKGDAPSTHIVKQSHIRLDRLVLNEQLCLQTAALLGIDTPESFIVDLGGGTDENILFATKRYDRAPQTVNKISGLFCPLRLHQEDFSQALGIPASQKYEKNRDGYMKQMFDCLRHNSSDPIRDQLRLWDRIIFNFLIGNTDSHVKNFSLIYNADLSSVRLSPAYDIVSTRAYNLSTDMSFAIGGEYNIEKIDRSTFKAAAKEVGLGEKLALSRFDDLSGRFEKALDEASQRLSDTGFADVHSLKNRILCR